MLFLVGSVSASEQSDNLQTTDDTDIDSSDVLTTSNEKIISTTNETNEIYSSSQIDSLSVADGTFTDLYNKVKNGGTVTLDRNYVYTAATDSAYQSGVPITVGNTKILGNGFTINGNNAARLFSVEAKGVEIDRINAINGNTASSYTNVGRGGAICWLEDNGKITNSNFTNMNAITGGYGGGAIWINASHWECDFCNFKDCYTKPSGGAINFSPPATCGYGRVTNCYFNNCSCGSNGGAIESYSPNAYFYNLTFVDCQAGDGTNAGATGGGIVVYSGAENTVISTCKFYNCSAGRGGAIGNYQPNCYNLTIEKCTFEGNHAMNGGAVFFNSINSTVSECTFTDNYATESGGAVSSNAENATVDDCSFENNEAPSGVNFYASSTENTITIVDCDFDVLYISDDGTGSGLRSDDPTNWEYAYGRIANGGRIILVGDFTTLLNLVVNKPIKIIGEGSVTINANNNGRIFDVKADDVNISSITFKNGKADNGGAIIWNGDYGILTNCIFDSNTATAKGGALYINGTGLTANSNQFKSNSAVDGGAVYIEGDNTLFDSSSFTSNHATTGGAIYNVASGFVLSKPTFTTNSATTDPDVHTTTSYTTSSQTYYTTLTITANDIVYGNDLLISGTLSDYANNAQIDLIINGQVNKKITVSGGTFSTTITKPAAGTYTITLGSSDQNNHAYLYNKYTPKTVYVYHEDSFYALQKLINEATTTVVTLARDYKYYPAYDSADGILIDKVITLNGDTHSIDGLESAKLLDVQKFDVVVANLTLKNGNAVEGGAITWNGTSGTISNVIFTNNQATNYNNIYSTKTDLNIVKSTFNNIAVSVSDSGATTVNYGTDINVVASFNDGTNLGNNNLNILSNDEVIGSTTNGAEFTTIITNPVPGTYTLTFATTDDNENTYTFADPSSDSFTVNRISTIYIGTSSSGEGTGIDSSNLATWNDVSSRLTDDGTVVFAAGTYDDFNGKTVNKAWTLTASSKGSAVITGDSTNSIFVVKSAGVTINNLMLTNGNVAPISVDEAVSSVSVTNSELQNQIEVTLSKSSYIYDEDITITGSFGKITPSTITAKSGETTIGTSTDSTASYTITRTDALGVGSYAVTTNKT